LDNIREEVFDGLGFRFTAHDESVVLDGGISFGVLEVKDCVVISEEVDFINSERVSSDFLDDALDDLIAASLSNKRHTVVLLTTLTLRRWLPLPPVLASPTRSLSF